MKESFSLVAKNTSPLCFIPSGKLVCYKNGNIQIIENDIVIKTIVLFSNLKEKFLGRVKILRRLLRSGIRSAIAIGNSTVILSIGNIIYELNIDSGILSNGYVLPRGIRPLSFSEIKRIPNFTDGIYFGGYDAGNKDKKPISLYKRVSKDKWIDIYTFSNREINHVHNIVADNYRNCVWIFTGDFGDAAAIWRSDDGFKTIHKVFGGDQKYRGCVAFARPEGLIYATDSPFAKNYIYCITPNGKLNQLIPISGSCIYGCMCNDKLIFSTTVEPDGRDETLMKLFFDYRIGAGIEDRYARIYEYSSFDNIIEICKVKKDFMPFLFQFGAFKFPSGNNNTGVLYFQPTALSKCDMNIVKVRIS